jgi:hypothetical protein
VAQAVVALEQTVLQQQQLELQTQVVVVVE